MHALIRIRDEDIRFGTRATRKNYFVCTHNSTSFFLDAHILNERARLFHMCSQGRVPPSSTSQKNECVQRPKRASRDVSLGKYTSSRSLTLSSSILSSLSRVFYSFRRPCFKTNVFASKLRQHTGKETKEGRVFTQNQRRKVFALRGLFDDDEKRIKKFLPRLSL